MARTQFHITAAADGLAALLTHGLLIGAVLLNVQSLWIFVALYFAPSSLLNVIGTAACWKGVQGQENTKEIQAMFRYGLSTSAVTVISMIAEQIERIAVFLLLSPVSLAVYLAGDRISELVRSVVQDAAGVLAPRFARMTTYEGRVERTVWLVCVAAGAVIVTFALTFAPTVLLLIFGQDYAPSVPYAQALLCSVAVGNVGQFQFRFIRSQLDGESFRIVILWTSGVRIVAGFGLVALFGIWGAVVTVFIHRFTVSALSSALIRRRYRSSPLAHPAE